MRTRRLGDPEVVFVFVIAESQRMWVILGLLAPDDVDLEAILLTAVYFCESLIRKVGSTLRNTPSMELSMRRSAVLKATRFLTSHSRSMSLVARAPASNLMHPSLSAQANDRDSRAMNRLGVVRRQKRDHPRQRIRRDPA